MAGEQKETIVLDARDETKKATDSANANIASVEQAAADASAAITKTTGTAGRATVNVVTSSSKAIDKIVADAQRKSDRLTLTKVGQLESEKARQVSKVGGNTEAINQITVAYDRMITHAVAAERATSAAAESAKVKSATVTAAVKVQAAAYDKAAEAAQRLATAEALRSKTALVPVGATAAGMAQARSQNLLNELQKQQRIVEFLEGRGGAVAGAPRLVAAQSAIARIREEMAALSAASTVAQKTMMSFGQTVVLSGDPTAFLKSREALEKVSVAGEKARGSLDRIHASSKMRTVAVDIERGASGLERFATASKSVQSMASSLGQSLTIGVTAPLVLAGRESLLVAERLDQIDKSISTILGSHALSKVIQMDLREASRTPGSMLTFEGAASGFRRIVATRRDITLAADAVKEFGNALALAGGTEEDMQGVSLALTQILSKARVSAEEINQIAERIPATRTLIMKAFGTSDSEAIVKMGITPDMFVTGIVDQAKLLPRAVESIGSQMKTVREDFRVAMGVVGHELAETLLPGLKAGAAAIRSFLEGFAKWPEWARRFTIVSATLLATLGPLLLALGGIARVGATVAQAMVLVQSAHAKSTTAAVTNTAAVLAEAKAYDALATSAGRAAMVQAGGTSTALIKTGATVAGGAMAGRIQDLQNELRKQQSIEAFLLGKGATEGSPRLVAAQRAIAGITAELQSFRPAATAVASTMEQVSVAFQAARVSGLAFLSIPLVGVLQGLLKALGDVGNSAKSALMLDAESGRGTTEDRGLVKVLSAAARNAGDLATVFAKDILGPQVRAFETFGDVAGGVLNQLKASYNDFVDMVSRSKLATLLVKPWQDLIDAGKRQLGIEEDLEGAQQRAQNLMAKGAREQMVAAGGLEKRGETETKWQEENAKIAARRLELTRDLRMELTKSTTEASRAGKQISEVEKVAADRAQERINMIEREGAAVGKLQLKLFDLATLQKLLEADRKNSYAAMEEATKFRDNAIEKELTGLAKIAEQRRQAVAALDARKLSAADQRNAMGLIDEGTAALTQRYYDQLLKDATDFYNQSAKLAAEGYDKIDEQRQAWLEKVKDSPAAIAQVNAAILDLERRLTRDLEREYSERAAARNLRGMDAQRDTYLRELELQNARALEIETSFGHENLDRRIQYEQDRLAIEQDFANRRLDMEIEAIKKRRDAAAAGATTFKQWTEVMRRAEEDMADVRQTTQIDIDAKRQQTAIRLEELVRQENQKTFDTFKRSYDDLFDALILRTRSFADVAKGILQAAFLTPVKEATGNMFAKWMTDIFGIKRLGASAVVQSKLELPNRIGDLQLQGGAAPVVIVGTTPQAARQMAAPTSNALSNLGNLGSLFGGMGALGRLGATPPFVPGGSVSSSIDFGGGSIPLGGTTYGGTPPFVSSQGGGFGNATGLTGMWGNLNGMLGSFGNIGMPKTGPGSSGGAMAGMHGIGGVTGGLMMLGGAALAINGLRQGGWGGFAQTTAGGALIGAKFGGPIGALIGGAIGAAAGGIRMAFKGRDEKIIEKVKSLYGVTIDSKFAKDPIGAIVQSKFGGNLDVGLRSPEVRDLVNLYGRATGQQYGLVNKAFGVGLEQTGGVLSQYAARADGLNVAYAGGTLGLTGPVDRVVTSTVGDSLGMAQTIRVDSLQLLVNGQSAATALAAGVVENPQAVATATLTANRRGINRRENLALQQQPGLLMA